MIRKGRRETQINPRGRIEMVNEIVKGSACDV